MCDQCLVVKLLMDIETVPEVAAYHDTTKAEVFCNPYVVDVHPSQCVHMAVYQSTSCCLFQLIGGEGRLILGKCLTVEDVLQEHIIHVALRFLQVFYLPACAADLPFVAIGYGDTVVVDMNTSQLIFLF